METMNKAICKKNFISEDGTIIFSKGRVYDVDVTFTSSIRIYSNVLESTVLILPKEVEEYFYISSDRSFMYMGYEYYLIDKKYYRHACESDNIYEITRDEYNDMLGRYEKYKRS